MENRILARRQTEVLNDMENFRNNLLQLYTTEEMIKQFGVTHDEYILDVSKKSLEIAKDNIVPKKKSYLWLGINPPPGAYTMLELHNKTSEAINKYKMLTEHAWTVEAHTENGYRPHVHMMIPTGTRPARVVELLAKHYNTKNQSIECKAGHSYEEHLKYIKGDKKNEKISNVEKDVEERKSLHIQNYYLSLMYNEQ